LLEIILIALFAWFFFGSLGLIFRLTWGVAKVLGAIVLFVIALPILILLLVFAGGIFLLCPVLIVVGAFVILKKIIRL